MSPGLGISSHELAQFTLKSTFFEEYLFFFEECFFSRSIVPSLEE